MTSISMADISHQDAVSSDDDNDQDPKALKRQKPLKLGESIRDNLEPVVELQETDDMGRKSSQI